MISILVDAVLEILTGEDYNLYPRPFENVYHFSKRLEKYKKSQYDRAVWALQRRGAVKVFKKNNQKFIQCTKKGQLEILFKKAMIPPKRSWDGKWRLVIFDIPEESRNKRDQLRFLLKRNNFIKLQASVFVSPYPLNREAIKYLQETGLDRFVRVLRVDEMDNEKELKKKFKLKHSYFSRP